MNTPQIAACWLVLLATVGCAEKADAAKAKADAEAKAQDDGARARAEAARKEMDALPKVFSTPDYLKKNKQTPTTETPIPVTRKPDSK